MKMDIESSTDNHELNLDNLPAHIYHLNLFNYFDLEDIWNFRLINKKLYFITKSYNIDELSFTKCDNFRKDNWFSTTKSIKLRNYFDISKVSILKRPLNSILNLKYLRITSKITKAFKLNELNKFSKLQILELHTISEDLELRLPDLNALSIGFNEGNLVSIDAPYLHSIEIINFKAIDTIQFKNPLSIEYIRIQSFNDRLFMFLNLKYLELCDRFDTKLLNVNLSKFTKLKKFKVRGFRKNQTYRLRDLFQTKRDDIDMILTGVQFTIIDKINEFKMKSELEFQLDNYDDLEDNLNFITDIFSNELSRMLSNRQPDLYKKFNNIQQITISTKIENENRLINFIEECANLYLLKFEHNSSLSQQFYDQLPAICSITQLELFQQEPILFFHFIGRISFLTNLDLNFHLINENLDLDHLKYLQQIRLSIFDKFVVIKKDKNRRFKIDQVIRNGVEVKLPNQMTSNLRELTRQSNYFN